MKLCTKCLKNLDFTEFWADRSKPTGFYSSCKICVLADREPRIEIDNARKKLYRETNKLALRDRAKIYYQANKVKFKEKRNNNRESLNLKGKLYYKNNKKKIILARHIKYNTDSLFKLTVKLRSRLQSAIKFNSKKGSAVKDLGCTIEELKIHLEKQFQPGMTWENYGIGGWHIDHIKPLCHFNLENREDFLIANNFSNLRPIWEKEHRIKSGKERSFSASKRNK